MVALASLPYPIATFIAHKAQNRARTILVQCPVRVLGSPSRRIRRKNYLRPKILKTLTKPYPGLTPEDAGTPIEPNGPIVEVPLDSSASFVEEELDMSAGGSVEEIEVVRDAKGTNLIGLKGVSGGTMFRIVASFVGLFVLQTVVSVWMMGSGDSDENGRSFGVGGRYGKEMGSDGSNVVGNSGFLIVDEDKIDEIRRMARAVREAERRKKNLEDDGADLEDVSDDDEDLEADSPVRSGIAKEIDGRLTTLRKRSSSPLLNVEFFNKSGGSGTGAKDGGLIFKEEDDRLMFEAKRKFRSKLTTPGDKPKGFQGGAGVKETNGNKNGKQETSNIGMRKVENASQHSSPLQVSMKTSDKAEMKSDKVFHGSTTLRSVDKSGKGINEGPRPETGVVQKYSNGSIWNEGAKSKDSYLMASQDMNLNDLKASTSSNIQTMQRRNGQPDSENLKRKVSGGSDQDKKHNDSPNPWWSTLPCVFVILMQKGHGNEAQQGFYTIQIKSDADYLSSYIVAFEDQNDARNFSYILDSVFEDLPDAAIDVALMTTEELREIIESLSKRVIVARKGELKLYAGQPLVDAENALKSIAK